MKNLLKRASMPIIVFGLAVGGVFATNVAKNAEMQTNVQGYLQVNDNPTNCDPVKRCTTVNINEVCTWTVGSTIHNLYGKDGLMECVIPLFEIEPKE